MKAKEKRGGSSNRDPMLAKVEEITQTWDLLDFNPIQGIYTWSNNRVGLGPYFCSFRSIPGAKLHNDEQKDHHHQNSA
jgi:hypothetical protein